MLGFALLYSALAQPVAAGELQLTQENRRYALWPVLTMLPDPKEIWSAEQLIGRTEDFQPVPATVGTLGLREGAVWLRAFMVYQGEAPERWFFHLDYAPTQWVETFVVRRGKIAQTAKLGSLEDPSARMFKSRTHATPIDLRPGERVELLIRVKTRGAMILPLSTGSPNTLLDDALAEQCLQGAMAGLALGLLIYSLLQWLALRDSIFFHYAVFTLGALCFSLQFFGLGAQYLWGGRHWYLLHAGGLAGLVAAIGALLFAGQTLKRQGQTDWLPKVTQGAAVLTACVAAMFALDLLASRTTTLLMTLLGLAPALLTLPRALQLARRGDAVGTTMLSAWLIHLVGVGVIFGLAIGRLPAQFWSMHALQFGSTAVMLLFMRVLSLRVLEHRLAIVHAERERDQMRSLAHTDALTGLANRRGLDLMLTAALESTREEHLLAIFMVDLDGFKAINDEFGHEVGDAVLIAVARRLEGQVRHSDVVARLGGDEFVVVVREPEKMHKAHMRGVQLLEAFYTPLQVAGRQIKVAMTIGYALAPLDGTDAVTLLRRADEALYEGKQDGKFCVRRLSPRKQATPASA